MNLPLSGIRYIRDYLDGSNINFGNHWVEIQAFSGATNIALNKTVISNHVMSSAAGGNITNGVSNNSSAYADVSANYGDYSYVQIDLGSINSIDTIKIWHYYLDLRVYNRTKTEVSVDGVEWFSVRDYITDGLYAESAAGLSIPLTYTPNTTTGTGGNARVLFVAGGGGGGMNMGGGGGAGGVISNSSVNVGLGVHSVIVGGGGRGAVAAGVWGNGNANNYTYKASQGYNTQALGLTAIGGGYGSTGNSTMTPNLFTPGNGGSGGGVSAYGALVYYAGGSGTSGQGNAGGNYNSTSYYGGGGGGAGGVGVTGSPGVLPHGGPGIADNITGTNYIWGGGGGASGYSQGGGNGGTGGGGGGAILVTTGGTGGINPGQAGTNGPIVAWANVPGGNGGANTGGGGGGGSHYNANNKGGDGGSGIVVIRYPTNGTIQATGGTITIVGSDTIHTFLTSGIFTVSSNAVPPIISSISDIIYENNISYTTDLNTYITTVSVITNYNLVGTLPVGLSFNSTTGIITGSSTQIGTYALTIDSTNQYGVSNVMGFNIVVKSAVPPVITTISDQTFNQTTSINLNLSSYVTATNNDTVTYGLTGTLPLGLSFDSATGVISGIYIETITTSLTFTASDKDGISNKVFNLTTIPKSKSISGTAGGVLISGGGGGASTYGGGGGGSGTFSYIGILNLQIGANNIVIGQGGTAGLGGGTSSILGISLPGGSPGVGIKGGASANGQPGSALQGLNTPYGGGGGGGYGGAGAQGRDFYNGGALTGNGGGGVLISGNGMAQNYILGGGGGGAQFTNNYSGGGGGAGGNYGGGAGGSGGGYNGVGTQNGFLGIMGTGGGGGGGSVGGAGGSGKAVIWYRTDGTDGISNTSTGGTISIYGAFTVHTFYSSGILNLVRSFVPPVITSVNDVIVQNNTSTSVYIGFNGTNYYNNDYYQVTGYLPAGITFNTSTGNFGGQSRKTGTYPLTFRLFNIDGGSNTVLFNYIISNPTPPILDVIPDITIDNGINPNIDIVSLVTPTNVDPILGYYLTGNIPFGLSISNSGFIVGQPTKVGSYILNVRVSDKDGYSTLQSFTLTINPKKQGPISESGSFNLLTNTF